MTDFFDVRINPFVGLEDYISKSIDLVDGKLTSKQSNERIEQFLNAYSDTTLDEYKSLSSFDKGQLFESLWEKNNWKYSMFYVQNARHKKQNILISSSFR